jgi:hypothetical protein
MFLDQSFCYLMLGDEEKALMHFKVVFSVILLDLAKMNLILFSIDLMLLCSITRILIRGELH